MRSNQASFSHICGTESKGFDRFPVEIARARSIGWAARGRLIRVLDEVIRGQQSSWKFPRGEVKRGRGLDSGKVSGMQDQPLLDER